MVGSPAWDAVRWITLHNTLPRAYFDRTGQVIAKQEPTGPAPDTGEFRRDDASPVRLIQVDWATVDHRSPIGWVFGTFMYDGLMDNADKIGVRLRFNSVNELEK